MIIIHSYYYEDNYETLDGFYKVEVPERFADNYKQMIVKAGKKLSETDSPTSLSYILDKLGWAYEKLNIETFNVDYNIFV